MGRLRPTSLHEIEHFLTGSRYGGITPLRRFLVNVNSDGDCWLWQGSRTDKGYGQMNLSGQSILAHRLSYLLCGRTLNADEEVCHDCDNPPCVNPLHLFAASHRGNMADASDKGRLIGVWAKLSDEQIREIRARGSEGPRKLGREFGLAHVQIINILRGVTYRHVK